ncbi:MAG: phage terminase large subunit [Candidatus Omnitrophica bacterium]|nr:phage terminase large subunit [Candidatus Omnitrophota bacterium]
MSYHCDITIDGGEIVLPFTEPQLELYYDIPERFLVVPKGRRYGITSSAAAFCIDMLLEGKYILWVDTVQVNLDKYFKKYFFPILKRIDPKFWRYRTQQKDLNILHGVMDFRSAEKPENIEGFGYHKIMINEAGIVLKGQKGRSLWLNSIFPMTLDFRADVYFLGTPKGKRAKKDESPHKTTLYYELAKKGGLESDEDKQPDWATRTFSSYDNPLLDENDIKELEEEVPRITRRQEIHGEFIDVGDEEVFHEHWFDIVYELPPKHLWKRMIISLDTAFKKGCENDDSAGVCVIETANDYFWIDTFCEKLEFPELIKKAEEFYLKHNPDMFLIEDKASGTSLFQTFRDQFPYPVRAITPTGDKFSRAVSVTPYFEAKKVHLLFGAWNGVAKDQLCDFNARLDTMDDIVDAASQLFIYVKGNPVPKAKAVTRKGKKTPNYLRGYIK